MPIVQMVQETSPFKGTFTQVHDASKLPRVQSENYPLGQGPVAMVPVGTLSQLPDVSFGGTAQTPTI